MLLRGGLGLFLSVREAPSPGLHSPLLPTLGPQTAAAAPEPAQAGRGQCWPGSRHLLKASPGLRTWGASDDSRALLVWLVICELCIFV